jgi:hypothetical protein
MKNALNLCGLSLALAFASSALAKLPAPPATPEAKTKAAEAAARTAWSAKVDSYQLCQAQTRVADHVRDSLVAAGKPVPAATPTPPCTDPGPFAFAPPEEAKPIEASGAHSPATTAASPPSSNQTSAETNPAPKK